MSSRSSLAKSDRGMAAYCIWIVDNEGPLRKIPNNSGMYDLIPMPIAHSYLYVNKQDDVD